MAIWDIRAAPDRNNESDRCLRPDDQRYGPRGVYMGSLRRSTLLFGHRLIRKPLRRFLTDALWPTKPDIDHFHLIGCPRHCHDNDGQATDYLDPFAPVAHSQSFLFIPRATNPSGSLKRDGFRKSCQHALSSYLRMIFSENRFALFRIMLQFMQCFGDLVHPGSPIHPIPPPALGARDFR